MAIVLASNNRGKLREFAQLFAPYHVQFLPQSQFVAEGAEETGNTFLENALLKARHASRAARMPAIADDSGIEVDALHGAPGVYSARYAGVDASDEDNNQKLLADLASITMPQRTARFRCVLVYVRDADDQEPIVAEGVWDGSILDGPRGEGGFGYDPLFLPSDSVISAGAMTAEAKNAVSHRAQALQKLVASLLAYRLIGSHD